MRWITIVAVCLMSTVAWGASHKWEDPLPHNCGMACNGIIPKPKLPEKLDYTFNCDCKKFNADHTICHNLECKFTDTQIASKINAIIEYLENQ